MARPILPKQPPAIISYLQVGKLLYTSLLLFIAESFYFLNLFQKALDENSTVASGIWLVCFIFSFVHIFLVLMDGWSRFQNYKKVKDLLYTHGFRSRIVKNYKGSKCQRNAVLVAAIELGMENEIRIFYQKTGVKWHQFIPLFMLEDPFFLFKKSFWSRTFLEKQYKSKFDFRQISATQILPN